MSKNETCFIYRGEIYYKIEATHKEIDIGLQHMVDDAMYYDEFEHSTELVIQAQLYLISRQTELIMKKHCS